MVFEAVMISLGVGNLFLTGGLFIYVMYEINNGDRW